MTFRVVTTGVHPYWGIESSTFSQALRKTAKGIPGMRWGADEGVKAWIGYSDAVATTVAAMREEGLRLEGDVRPIDTEAPSIFTPSYEDSRDYQRQATDWTLAHAKEGCILALDLGLGKTLVALRAARAIKEPTLVVCPAFVQGIWGDDDTSEVKKWWRDAWPPRVLEGLKAGPWYVAKDDVRERRWYWQGPGGGFPELGGTLRGDWVTDADTATRFWTHADAEEFIERKWSPEERKRIEPQCVPAPMEPRELTVCNYSILHAWAPHLTGVVKTLIADECHFVSNSKTLRSGALADIAASCRYRIGLTGTPLTNRPRDLHNLVNTLCPGRFGTFPSFGIRYCGGRKEEVPQRGGAPPRAVWKFDGSSNLDELSRRLSFFMLRKTKEDVGMQLPPRTLQTILLDVKKSFVAPPRSIISDSALSEKALRRALDLAADGKLPQVASLVASHVSAGHNVVVFCWRRQVARILHDLLTELTGETIEVIHGEIPPKERQRRIASDWRVLCATIDVTAGGISLTHADVGVYAELTWEPHEILQTMGRLFRFGQKKATLFQVTVARGSVDELVSRELMRKDGVIQRLLGGGDTDLAKLLAETKAKDPQTQLRSLYERLRKSEA